MEVILAKYEAKTHFLLSHRNKAPGGPRTSSSFLRKQTQGFPGEPGEHEADLDKQDQLSLSGEHRDTVGRADCLPGRKWKAARLSVYSLFGGVS